MNTLVVESYGPPQSGKTTLALSIIRGAKQAGLEALYVVPTQEMARWVVKRRQAPASATTWSTVVRDAMLAVPEASIVVVDDADRFDKDTLAWIKHRLESSTVVAPRQLVLFYGS